MYLFFHRFDPIAKLNCPTGLNFYPHKIRSRKQTANVKVVGLLLPEN